MHLDKMMAAMACMVGILLGLLVGVSFAETPIPDEASGRECVDLGSSTCNRAMDQACAEVGACVFCDGSGTYNGKWCLASAENLECKFELSGSTSVNCGDSYEGDCQDNQCEDTVQLIDDDGCAFVKINCSGHQTPTPPG